MARRPRGPRDVREDRPASPYRPDGTLDPREWKVACSAAGVITLVILAREPWFVAARPVEIVGKGVELEVVVRWLSTEVWERVPLSVDDYPVNVVLDGASEELHTIH